MSEDILSTTSDGILRITVNRTARKNAMTSDMYRELTRLLTQAKTKEDVKVIVIFGSAGIFMAGNDIADFVSTPPVTRDAPRQTRHRGC
jgi:enoyl-CoA hydratase/carnithine racemase